MRPLITTLFFFQLFIFLSACDKNTPEENELSPVNLDSLEVLSHNLPNGRYKDAFFFDTKVGFVVSYNQVYKTVDGGKKWVKVFDEPAGEIDFKEVSFFDNLNGIAVGSSPTQGIIIYTNDGGDNWMYAQKEASIRPRNISIVSGNSAYLLADHRFLYFTDDHGKNWRKIPGPDSRPITAVRFKNTTEGVVAGSGKFYSTKDSGLTWGEGGTNIKGNISTIDYVGDDIIFRETTSMTKISQTGNHLISEIPVGITDVHFISSDKLIACGKSYEGNVFNPTGMIYTSNNFWSKYYPEKLGDITSEFTTIGFNGENLYFFATNYSVPTEYAKILKLSH